MTNSGPWRLNDVVARDLVGGGEVVKPAIDKSVGEAAHDNAIAWKLGLDPQGHGKLTFTQSTRTRALSEFC